MATTTSLLEIARGRARTQHRVLRLLTTARKVESDQSSLISDGLATLLIGRCISELQGDAAGTSTACVRSEMALKLKAALAQPQQIPVVLEDLARPAAHRQSRREGPSGREEKRTIAEQFPCCLPEVRPHGCL